MKKKKAVVAGHICVDFTPPMISPSAGTGNRIEDFLTPGKLVHVGPAYFHPGGVVVNTGLTMKSLGADVMLMGKTGDDHLGRIIRDFLEQNDAAAALITDPASDTSYTVVLAPPGIDRVFLHNPGTNDAFTAMDIDYAACESALLFHFGYPPLMRRMYQDGGRELAEVFRRVKEKGCLTSLDMAALDDASEAGQADWETILRKTLPYVDFFVPSMEEICFMLDRPRYHALQKRAAGGDVTRILSIGEDVMPLAERLLDMGCKLALIKCGVAGMYCRTAGSGAFDMLRGITGLKFEGFDGQSIYERSFVPKAVVSGTGAGDAAIGAFLTAMMKGYSLEWCLHLAAAEGACCVAALDALSGLKPLEELKERILSGWARQGGKDGLNAEHMGGLAQDSRR
ncbi:MAG: carbohydrate kinase family protein [Fretibacterium sp.]|nr:carbohydrate kinase family protein [Fretibacterium sp.]